MNINVHIFPDSFSPSPEGWAHDMQQTLDRVRDVILDATINASASALGSTTLLDLEDQGYIVATVSIERE